MMFDDMEDPLVHKMLSPEAVLEAGLVLEYQKRDDAQFDN